MMKKKSYETHHDGVRYYDSEKEGKEAVVDAELLDAAIAEMRPASEIMQMLRTASGRLAAVIARSLRFGRLFYSDFLSEADADARRFFREHAFAVPYFYQRLLKNRDLALPVSEFRWILEMLSSGGRENFESFRAIYANEKWLAGRLLQDDVYLSCCDEAKEFLLDIAMNAAPEVRRPFVAQIMTGGCADAGEKSRVYRKLRPYAEFTTRATQEQVKTSTYLLGHHVFANAAHSGLTVPYSGNASSPDYHLAICSKIQESYAESGYVRYQWSRNKLPGYETIRCSFPKFASMTDNFSKAVDMSVMESVCIGDNPGNLVLACDLEGLRFGLKQIVYLMRYSKRNILKFILGEAPDLLPSVNIRQMLFYVSAYGDWTTASEAATTIEAAAPGTVAKAFDCFGNTPIWYTLYSLESAHQYDTFRGAAMSHDTSEGARKEYVKLLESFGCNRYHKNHLGISYADL